MKRTVTISAKVYRNWYTFDLRGADNPEVLQILEPNSFSYDRDFWRNLWKIFVMRLRLFWAIGLLETRELGLAKERLQASHKRYETVYLHLTAVQCDDLRRLAERQAKARWSEQLADVPSAG